MMLKLAVTALVGLNALGALAAPQAGTSTATSVRPTSSSSSSIRPSSSSSSSSLSSSVRPTSTTPTSTGSTSPTPNPTAGNADLLRQLQDAASFSQKIDILLPNRSDTSRITFQFINNTVSSPTGGTIALAEINGFPALELGNTAMAIGFVNACGLNVPHSHPRATEFLTVVQGSLIAGLIIDTNPGSAGNVPGANPATLNGPGVQVNTTLNQYRGTIFPQGETHFQFNPNCEPAVFAAAFDNRDPGRSQLARTFFSVRPDPVIEASLGELGRETIDASQIDTLRDQIPGAFAVLIEDCARRCGIIS